MADIIATNSCHRQQLICALENRNVQPMVANTKDDFAERLNQACDNAVPAITKGRGRRAELRRRVIEKGKTVSGESVRKWLSGDSIPSMDSLRYIASALGTDADQLLTGRIAFSAKQESRTPHVAETAAGYTVIPMSQEARAIAEFYDKLPLAVRGEFRAAMVRAFLQMRISSPEADLGQIGDIVDLMRNN